ncbi:MAG: hypothetical protein COZ18_11305 [Flexibacter sp. CG_4_10_14_3_um_filter_32_15]|nr:MAG: hypothetical protein COZ18_11305 [Flexibacter sp. CG_4_10_14_3_um_filter_32_15]
MNEKIINNPNSKKHICFVSVGHISSNPRLVKEATLAAQKGYNVSIVGVQTLEKLVSFDEELIEKNPNWNVFIYPFYQKKGLYFLGTFFHHFAKRLPKLANQSILGKLSISTPLWFPIYHYLKSIKADLYIVHNITMLPLVVKIAKKNNAKIGLDIEDAYAVMSEGIDENIVDIEKKYLSQLDYLTCASPLYVDFYNKHYQNLPTITPILNVFEDVEEQEKKEYKDRKNTNNLSLYWFSQTTGKGRGIEQIIEALNVLDRSDIELHLRGIVSQETKEYFLSLVKSETIKKNIFFHPLVSNQELASRTAEHDIGLALELKEPLNRDLCLTNKIFQYLNTGLAILASNTTAQKFIMEENPQVGFLINIENAQEVAQKIEILANSKKNTTDELENMKIASKNLSKTKYNWDIEGQKFLEVIKDCLEK